MKPNGINLKIMNKGTNVLLKWLTNFHDHYVNMETDSFVMVLGQCAHFVHKIIKGMFQTK